MCLSLTPSPPLSLCLPACLAVLSCCHHRLAGLLQLRCLFGCPPHADVCPYVLAACLASPSPSLPLAVSFLPAVRLSLTVKDFVVEICWFLLIWLSGCYSHHITSQHITILVQPPPQFLSVCVSVWRQEWQGGGQGRGLLCRPAKFSKSN